MSLGTGANPGPLSELAFVKTGLEPSITGRVEALSAYRISGLTYPLMRNITTCAGPATQIRRVNHAAWAALKRLHRLA